MSACFFESLFDEMSNGQDLDQFLDEIRKEAPTEGISKWLVGGLSSLPEEKRGYLDFHSKWLSSLCILLSPESSAEDVESSRLSLLEGCLSPFNRGQEFTEAIQSDLIDHDNIGASFQERGFCFEDDNVSSKVFYFLFCF